MLFRTNHQSLNFMCFKLLGHQTFYNRSPFDSEDVAILNRFKAIFCVKKVIFTTNPLGSTSSGWGTWDQQQPKQSDYSVPYPEESYPFAEMKSLYSTAPVNWTTFIGGVLALC